MSDKKTREQLRYYINKAHVQGETIARLSMENIHQRKLLEEANKIITSLNYIDRETKLVCCIICGEAATRDKPHATDCPYAAWFEKINNSCIPGKSKV